MSHLTEAPRFCHRDGLPLVATEDPVVSWFDKMTGQPVIRPPKRYLVCPKYRDHEGDDWTRHAFYLVASNGWFGVEYP